MGKKFRSAESYYGNTKKARERQRSNLVGGNIYRKRKVSEARINCFWEVISLEDLQWIFEKYVNGRWYKDIPKEELKTEEYLDEWWDKLEYEERKHTYKNAMAVLDKGHRDHIFNDMEKCLKKKLKKM